MILSSRMTLEIENAGKLERGMYVSKFYAKRKPEKKLLSVRRETMMLVWSRVVAAGSSVQGGLSGQSSGHGGASGGQGGHGQGVGGGGQFSGQSSFRNAYEGAIDIRDIKDVSWSCRVFPLQLQLVQCPSGID